MSEQQIDGGVSLGRAGLKVEGDRQCPEGGGHAVNEGVLAAAQASGRATGPCAKCGANVTIGRA